MELRHPTSYDGYNRWFATYAPHWWWWLVVTGGLLVLPWREWCPHGGPARRRGLTAPSVLDSMVARRLRLHPVRTTLAHPFPPYPCHRPSINPPSHPHTPPSPWVIDSGRRPCPREGT
ncbi:hypothetical protein E2C01_057575 [Portunus trituberculatus]|uniref:Uncharacterized protein n=1 Tax=Portunus trituberculatus TaxID=210409 RepID=A0A5B7H2A9_PORTR|nr:hypothetical protein [Portunus trituberculatus]